ncbi:three-helix bundle dimerization domain-containing protein [Gordonia sp. NPDC003424]
MNTMHGGNERQLVEAVCNRLMSYFPDRTSDEVTVAVDDAYARYRGAKSAEVIPLLVEHRASATLRGLELAAG